MAISPQQDAQSLVEAIDDLLAHVENAIAEDAGGIGYGFSYPDYERFLELDRHFAALATVVKLGLPAIEKLRPSLAPEIEKPVEFAGLTNLPGDWDKGVFLLCPGPWRDEMCGLRACAVQLAGQAAKDIIESRPTVADPATMPAKTTERGDDKGEAKSDDALPKSKRADSLSRLKASSAYEYAMKHISNAYAMTGSELFDAIKKDGEVAELLPPTAESFTRYLNGCGIRLKKGSPKAAGGSVSRRSDL